MANSTLTTLSPGQSPFVDQGQWTRRKKKEGQELRTSSSANRTVGSNQKRLARGFRSISKMENEETTLVGIRGSNQAVDVGDPFINSALVHTASACLIFFVVFIFVLPGILLTTMRKETFVETDNRPSVRVAKEVAEQKGRDRPIIVCLINRTSYDREPPMRYEPNQVPLQWCSYVVYPLTGAADWTEDMLSFDYTHKMTHPNLYKDLVLLKKTRPSVKILLSVGEMTSSSQLFSYASQSMYSTIRFCSAVVRWTLGNGFDGLLIHNLFPSEPDANTHKIVILLQKLWVNFERRGLTLAVVFEPDSDVFKHEMVGGRLASYLDLAIVVSHGFRSELVADFSSPMHRAPSNQTFSFRSAIAKALQSGVPRHKLVATVSFDGNTYTLEDSANHDPGAFVQAGRSLGSPGRYTKTSGMLSYFEICQMLMKGNLSHSWDILAGCPYAYADDQWVGYEDEESLALKANHVLNESLAGVVVWDVTSDDYLGHCGDPHVLIKTLYQQFNKNMSIV
ncbi:chitinase-3-like protein 2 [Ornithodoros turicata]|uniref:chitinase-3-like protein 2 n=1 Tax=Ornithodoros turicata TaxID=34597 RepID=UPI0031397F21